MNNTDGFMKNISWIILIGILGYAFVFLRKYFGKESIFKSIFNFLAIISILIGLSLFLFFRFDSNSFSSKTSETGIMRYLDASRIMKSMNYIMAVVLATSIFVIIKNLLFKKKLELFEDEETEQEHPLPLKEHKWDKIIGFRGFILFILIEFIILCLIVYLVTR